MSGVLGVLVVLSYGLRLTNEPPTVSPSGSLNQYDLVDASIELANKQGNFAFNLTAPVIRKPTQSTVLLVEHPHFDWTNDTGLNWQGDAQLAELSLDSKKASFTDTVKLGLNEPHKPALLLTTSRLMVDLQQSRANAPNTADLTTESGRLRVDGFSVDLNQHHIHLNSSIHGLFTH